MCFECVWGANLGLQDRLYFIFLNQCNFNFQAPPYWATVKLISVVEVCLFLSHTKCYQGLPAICIYPCNYQSYPLTLYGSVWLLHLWKVFGAFTPPWESTVTLTKVLLLEAL